jgi:hypothetical protein
MMDLGTSIDSAVSFAASLFLVELGKASLLCFYGLKLDWGLDRSPTPTREQVEG